MSLQKNIKELLEAGVISPEIADNIQNYYKTKGGNPHNRLFVVFGVIGALLVGLGIILIVAHNWDNLSKEIKTILAFIPLLIGQGSCFFTLSKKPNSIAWRESSATFLFFAIGSCIALVGQIYNLPSNLSSFILTWMLLALPLVYILRSAAVSLFYLIGINFYLIQGDYWLNPVSINYTYWLLFLAIFPFYYYLFKSKPKSNFTNFHHWLIPLSLVLGLGTFAKGTETLMLVNFLSLLGAFYLFSQLKNIKNIFPRSNSYFIIGALGTIGILLGLSFFEIWDEIYELDYGFTKYIESLEFLVAIPLILIASYLLYMHWQQKTINSVFPIGFIFLIFIPIFILGHFSAAAVFLVNLLLLAIGIFTIRKGVQTSNLGTLNLGLLSIAALICCRFFDLELSFVLRGVIFILVGIGFFLANYWMLKQTQTNEIQ